MVDGVARRRDARDQRARSVNIVPGPSDRVDVRALKTWRGNPVAVRILAEVANGEVVVCVAAATGTCASPRLGAAGGDVAVQFSIAVPAGMRIVASTVNGDVSVATPARTVQASATNGNVVVQATSGRLLATTVNGTVTLYLAQMSDAVAEIEALAVTSDVPLRVVGRVLRSRMRVQFGRSPGRRWELKALRGTVGIRQGPAPPPSG